MQKITISGKEYKIKYGFNSFADTDLLERVGQISQLLNESKASKDSDVTQLGKIRELFVITRELLYVGMQKYNPPKDIRAVGDMLDTYREEAAPGESRGLIDIFAMLSNELTDEGFLSDLMNQVQTAPAAQKIR